MKAKLYSTCLVLSIAQAPYASATVVSGNITGTWTSAGSPYYVTGDIIVVDSLIIEAGVVVKFGAGGWHFNVESGDHFEARGTAEDSIIFEPEIGSNPGSWKWLYFGSSGTDDTVSYVHLRNAENGLWISGAGCAPYIEHCLLEGCSAAGANVLDRPSPYFYDCTFRNNQTVGAKIYSSLNVSTTAPTFYKCRFYTNVVAGIGIRTDNSGTATADIVNCTIVQNAGDGIELTENPFGNPTVDVLNCIIAFNGDKGIDDQTDNMTADGVAHTLFWANGTGDIAGFDATGFGETANYLNGNGDSCDVNLNLYYDPLICDTATRNYSLFYPSIAVDAGTSLILDQFIEDPDATPPDLGSEWPVVLVCTVGSVEPTDHVPNLLVHPNPFEETTTVVLNTASSGPVQIVDLLGQQIRSFSAMTRVPAVWNGRTTSGTEVPPGMYLVTVIADGQRYTQRVIKQ